jgi:kynurenine formamidase
MTAEQSWWPSPFGADDQLGMLNHIDAAKRRAATALVREGRLYDLSHVLDETSPAFPGRYFRQTLVTTAHHANHAMPLGENQVNWVTEVVSATMQLGTHLDALSHLQIGDRGYNGWTVAELAGNDGVKRLGAETIAQIVTRGWLVDVSERRLGVGGVISVDDLAGVEPEPGDAVVFHTGWGAYWDEPDVYLSGEPGPGYDVADWLVEHGVAVTGCEVPQRLNVVHGMFVVENLDTAELARDGVHEFALVLTHPKLRGATGAWTAPIALV